MKATNCALILTMLLLPCANVSYAQDSTAFDVFTRKADSLVKQGKHSEAIHFYNAAREEAEKLGARDPRLAGTWKKLAASYEATKNVKLANECLKKALGVMDGSAPAAGPSTASKGNPTAKPGTAAKGGQAARPVKPGTTATTTGGKDIDLGPYVGVMQTKVRSLWNPPEGALTRKVVSVFSIDSAGAVSNIKIKESSGSQAVDDSAIKAINDAAPFEALPPGAPARLDVQFELDYNVHQAKPPAADPPKK